MLGSIQPEPSEIVEPDGPNRHDAAEEPSRPESPSTQKSEFDKTHDELRILFLDDDPRRAEIFLLRNSNATWIQTAQECIDKLAESWDEVYLDHDLGGEHFVDVERADCGMEVVRWLCKEPRTHLVSTRFIIHSHNMTAALMMVLLMRETGYHAEFFPFGFSLELDPYSPTPSEQAQARAARRAFHLPAYRRLFEWLSSWFRRSQGPKV